MSDVINLNDLVRDLNNVTNFVEDKKDIENRNTNFNFLTENAVVLRKRKSLPIYQEKDELLQEILNNQIVIIVGETGSGKTTQIPQYLVEAGFVKNGKIACTQLRRMAAKAAAKRVADECGCELGKEVGYTIAFEDNTHPDTKIQYMTDGILLRECIFDNTLSAYSAIILDESHERTIDSDVLLAVLKRITQKRNDLKLIISSATLEADKLSSYFNNAKVFHIEGRMFPVQITYIPDPFNRLNIDLAVGVVKWINEMEKEGDILVFLTGEHDIELMEDRLSDYKPYLYSQLVMLPVYSALPWEQQALIFEPVEKGKRKVIMATNIAETSLTVDGIGYVIDGGFVKQKVYDYKKETEVLRPVRISQAQAIQRTGRAGRVGPGKCFRLYSENTFKNDFASAPNPEIKRSSPTNAVLLLKCMGCHDILELDFLDRPPKKRIQEAIKELTDFEALDLKGNITDIGKKMAAFPLEPYLAKMIIVSEQLGCSEEILTIVALILVPYIFYRPKRRQRQADAAKEIFKTNDGDLIMLMEVYHLWKIYDKDPEWCKKFFINDKLLCQAYYIRKQLLKIMMEQNMTVRASNPDMIPVRKCICAGFFKNTAKLRQTRAFYRSFEYKIFNGETAYVHPGSALFGFNNNSCIVYQKVASASKTYLLGVTPIEEEWL